LNDIEAYTEQTIMHTYLICRWDYVHKKFWGELVDLSWLEDGNLHNGSRSYVRKYTTILHSKSHYKT